MKHFAPITTNRTPASANDSRIPECLAYLLDTWDFEGFIDCWQEKKGCNCGDPE
ncbi:MAG: hypothetical protein KJ060_20305 [Candidatus Hydrogenedentes bacterium]|nr:hypothetical protein [Candidatus Hydrogenedentota bacterium]